MPDTLYQQLIIIPFDVAKATTPPKPVPTTTATNQLPPGKTVHYYFTTPDGKLMGKDMDRGQLLHILQNFHIHTANPMLTHIGHGLAVTMADNSVLYVATKTPLMSQENYRYHGAVCPACKTAHDMIPYPHEDSTTTKLRMLCRNCGSQWWHDAIAFSYSGLTSTSQIPRQ